MISKEMLEEIRSDVVKEVGDRVEYDKELLRSNRSVLGYCRGVCRKCEEDCFGEFKNVVLVKTFEKNGERKRMDLWGLECKKYRVISERK